MGDHQQALADARRATELASPGFRAARAWRFLCSTAIDLELFDEAEAPLRQAGRHDGGSVAHHLHVAGVAWQRSQPERAQAAAAAAIARDPVSVESTMALGYAALSAGDWERAEALFAEVERRDPTNCCAQAACALAAIERGTTIDVDDALASLEYESLNCQCHLVKLLRAAGRDRT